MTTMELERDKLMKRVSKLLNLANDNPNENEAQNALLKAQEMMAKNNISISDLDILNVKPEKKKEVSESAAEWTKAQWYNIAVSDIIADNFRCYVFRYTGIGKSKMTFMGLKEDCELAKTMYEFAVLALEYNADQYVKEQRQIRYIRDSKGIKTDYMKGFIKGLKDKFKKQVQEMSFALVLVKDDALVKAHDARKFTKGSGFQGGKNGKGDKEAFSSGYEKGNTFEASSGYIQ